MLGQAEPDHDLADACIQFLGKQRGIGYLPNVARYLMRYRGMTADQCEAFVRTMAKHSGYESILANMLDVLALQPRDVVDARVVRDLLTRAGLGNRTRRIYLQADLAFSLMRWQAAVGTNDSEIKKGIGWTRKSWLGTARIIDLFHAFQSEPSVQPFIESNLRSETSDVALSAAWWCMQCGNEGLVRGENVSSVVKIWLRGPVLAVAPSASAHAVLRHIIRVIPEIDWEQLVGAKYSQFATHLRGAAACWDTEVGRALDSWSAALRILEECEGVVEIGLAGKVRAVRERFQKGWPTEFAICASRRPLKPYAERDRLLVEFSGLFEELVDGVKAATKLEASHV